MARPRQIIEEGKRFGYLTFIRDLPPTEDKRRWSEFVCDCGKVVKYKTFDVISGHTIACGHMRGKKPKLNEEQRLDVLMLSKTLPIKEIAIKYNRDPSTIRSIINSEIKPEIKQIPKTIEQTEEGFFDVDLFFKSDFIFQS